MKKDGLCSAIFFAGSEWNLEVGVLTSTYFSQIPPLFSIERAPVVCPWDKS